MEMILYFCTVVLVGYAQDPTEAKSNSYGIEITTTKDGTELNYENPQVDVKGDYIKDVKVDSDDAKLILAMITKTNGDIMLTHPKMSVEGDMPEYKTDAGTKNPDIVEIPKHGTHDDAESRHVLQKVQKNALVKSYVSNKKQSNKDSLQSGPPEPDIPIELGVEEEKEEEEGAVNDAMEASNNDKNCEENKGAACKHMRKLKKKIAKSSDLSSSGDDENEIRGEDESVMSFPSDAPEVSDKVGSASEEDTTIKAETGCNNKKKPCQKPCAESNGCPKNDDESPAPQPDIPIELGSSMMETEGQKDSVYGEVTEGNDQVTYLPVVTPNHFVMIDNTEESGSGNSADQSEDVVDFSGNIEKRALHGLDIGEMGSGEHSDSNSNINFSNNTDGDYDGELLQKSNRNNLLEDNGPEQSRLLPALSRRRRSIRSISSNKKKTRKKNRQHSLFKESSKRSDIEADKELLETIENLNSEMATKRDLSATGKPLQGYMKKLAHDVRSVMGEARSVLRNTGKVVHSLKRVINGATVLTSFTNNAVNFAKYFSMEPNNATIDYLEEKAIVAVLEAQKAANEAKDAANLAKLASKKAIAAERRMEVAQKHHKKVQSISAYVHAAKKQSNRANKAAQIATHSKQQTENDVMLMDKELRKIGTQIKTQSGYQELVNARPVTYTPVIDNKQKASVSKNAHISNAQLSPSKSSANSNQNKKLKTSSEKNLLSADITDKNSYANYFYMKQKMLEKQLLNPQAGKLNSNKKASTQSTSIKTIDVIPLTQSEEKKPTKNEAKKTTDKEEGKSNDAQELQYIESLNKKIANIKKEEEEATQKLKAVELARTFAATSERNRQEPALARTVHWNDKTLVRENNNLLLPEPKSEPQRHVTSMLKTNVPAEKRQPIYRPDYLLPVNMYRYANARPKLSHWETSSSDILTKKGMIRKVTLKEPYIHLVPGEYTGFKKQEIIEHAPEQKSQVTQPENLVKEEYKEIEDAITGDENSAVADDFDKVRKREKVVYESKLLANKLPQMQEENDSTDSGSGEESGNFEETESKREYVAAIRKSPHESKMFSVVKKIAKGPVSVTVAVNRNANHKKTVPDDEFVDPFGFNQIKDTNEGWISDRTIIPKPSSDNENKRSYIPASKYNFGSDIKNQMNLPLSIVISDKK